MKKQRPKQKRRPLKKQWNCSRHQRSERTRSTWGPQISSSPTRFTCRSLCGVEKFRDLKYEKIRLQISRRVRPATIHSPSLPCLHHHDYQGRSAVVYTLLWSTRDCSRVFDYFNVKRQAVLTGIWTAHGRPIKQSYFLDWCEPEHSALTGCAGPALPETLAEVILTWNPGGSDCWEQERRAGRLQLNAGTTPSAETFDLKRKKT